MLQEATSTCLFFSIKMMEKIQPKLLKRRALAITNPISCSGNYGDSLRAHDCQGEKFPQHMDRRESRRLGWGTLLRLPNGFKCKARIYQAIHPLHCRSCGHRIQ